MSMTRGGTSGLVGERISGIPGFLFTGMERAECESIRWFFEKREIICDRSLIFAGGIVHDEMIFPFSVVYLE